MQDRLGAITRSIKEIELTLLQSEQFKGVNFPFKSPTIQIAYNHIVKARMFAGDLLRLSVQQENHRENSYFDPSEYYEQPERLGFDNQGEWASIQDLKSIIRVNFYGLIDSKYTLSAAYAEMSSFYRYEFFLYYDQLCIELKMADQQLGLRLGEITR